MTSNVIAFRKRETAHLGACPVCHSPPLMVHVGRDHYGTCEAHGVFWYIGRGLFSPPPPDIVPDHEWRDWCRRNREHIARLRSVEPADWQWCHDDPRPAA